MLMLNRESHCLHSFFILFINDLADFLRGSSNNGQSLAVENVQVFLLLFTDDTLLLSETRQGLQNLLHNMHQYCIRWNVTVNAAKTKVIVFRKGSCLEQFDLFYNNVKLEMVKKFTYLGVTLSSNGNFVCGGVLRPCQQRGLVEPVSS